MCVPSLSEGIKAAVPLKTDVIKRAQITTEDTRPHPLTVRILGAPQAKAGFFGPVGKAAVACLAGFYCPAGSAYGVTCPANTASPAGAADVLACLVIRMCWHGMHVFTWVCACACACPCICVRVGACTQFVWVRARKNARACLRISSHPRQRCIYTSPSPLNTAPLLICFRMLFFKLYLECSFSSIIVLE